MRWDVSSGHPRISRFSFESFWAGRLITFGIEGYEVLCQYQGWMAISRVLIAWMDGWMDGCSCGLVCD